MSTVSKTKLREQLMGKIRDGNMILSAYLTLGYPDLETSINAMIATANAGADIIEIGIPFSDPMADGLTIQHTNEIALQNGLDIHAVEQAIQQLRNQTDAAIIIMTYGNIIFQYPFDQFNKLCKTYHVDGIIIPDIPPEHAESIQDLNPIYLVAPNTNIDRIAYLAEHSSGFVYVVSKLGITGGKYGSDLRLESIHKELEDKYPNMPRLQGFGIDTVNSVANAISSGAHGVIIGSKLLRLLGDDGNIDAVTSFIREIRTNPP